MPEVKGGHPATHLLSLVGRFEKGLMLLAFTVLVLVVFSDVLARELTGAGLYWASRTAVWANVIVVMAGFGLASADGAHLRPRFADNWLPAGWSGALEFLQHAVMALFCAAIAWLSASVALESRALGEVAVELFLPVWPVQVFLPLAFSAAAIRHAIYAWVPELRPEESAALLTTGSAEAGSS